MAITLQEMQEKHNAIVESCRQIEGFDITPVIQAFQEIEEDYTSTVQTLADNTGKIETLQGEVTKAKEEIYNMFMTRGVSNTPKENEENQGDKPNEEKATLEDFAENFGL